MNYATISDYENALREALDTQDVTLTDDSHKHAGHGGWKEGAVTHISVAVTSSLFSGKSRVKRQQLIYAALKPFMEKELHAVRIAKAGDALR